MAFSSPVGIVWTLAFTLREIGTMKSFEQRSLKESQLLNKLREGVQGGCG